MSATLALCRDAPRSSERRQAHLRAHLAYIETILPHILVAGPTAGGSLLLFATADEGQARAWLEADPYFSADVWAEVSYAGFRPVAGSWLGGKSW